MEENNKIGEFFRNKLNDNLDENSQWDRPDLATKNNLLSNIRVDPSPAILFSKSLIIYLLTGALIASVAYNFYLSKKVQVQDNPIAVHDTSKPEDLKNKKKTSTKIKEDPLESPIVGSNPLENLATKIESNLAPEKLINVAIEEKEKAINSSDKSQFNLEVSSSSKKEVFESKANSTKESIKPIRKVLKSKLYDNLPNKKMNELDSKKMESKSSKEKILHDNDSQVISDKANLSNKQLNNKTLTESIISEEHANDITINEVLQSSELQTLSPAKLKRIFTNSNLLLPSLNTYKTILSPKKINVKKKREFAFEFGLRSTLRQTSIPIAIYLNESTEDKEIFDIDKIINSNGFQIGLSPMSRIWVNLGFNYASYSITGTQNFNIKYDDSEEENLVDGSRLNEINISTLSPFAKSTTNYTVGIAQGSELKEGDEVDVENKVSIELRQYQIPLRLHYIFGQSKLKYLLQVGLNYNIFKIEEVESEASFSFGRERLKVENQNNNDGQDDAVNNFAGLAGVGLQFNIMNQLNLRSIFFLDYNFNKKNDNFIVDKKLNPSISISLSYQF